MKDIDVAAIDVGFDSTKYTKGHAAVWKTLSTWRTPFTCGNNGSVYSSYMNENAQKPQLKLVPNTEHLATRPEDADLDLAAQFLCAVIRGDVHERERLRGAISPSLNLVGSSEWSGSLVGGDQACRSSIAPGSPLQFGCTKTGFSAEMQRYEDHLIEVAQGRTPFDLAELLRVSGLRPLPPTLSVVR